MNFESKIKELNIVLPKAADPVGSYVAAKITGKIYCIYQVKYQLMKR